MEAAKPGVGLRRAIEEGRGIMNDLPPALFQHWVHTFEQDASGTRSYKPSGAPMPRARGRGGIELRPDGTLVDIRIGRDDRSQRVTGRWHHVGQNRLLFTFDDGSQQQVEIVGLDDNELKMRIENRNP
jgi:hypothetical protein